MKYLFLCSLMLFSGLNHFIVSGQDPRGQLPPVLRNSYFEINMGYLNYPFSTDQLEPGYSVESIIIPHLAVRINLGYNFNEYLSAGISYLRPILWVRYNYVNGTDRENPVYMSIGTATIKGELPVTNKISMRGEGGLGLITRGGFYIDDDPEQVALKDAFIATFFLGAGVKYKPNDRWGLLLNTAYTPQHESTRQPYTIYFSGGFSYAMKPLSREKAEANSNSKYIFPHNMIQVGYSTNVFGYGVNNFFSKGWIPIFWGGKAEVRNGITVHYQRNAFHGRKFFSLDWGTSFSYYRTENTEENFWALSIFPLFRFTVLHLKPFDMYLNYSVAGPTYISEVDIDGEETGPKFTFQDLMGMGFYFGKSRIINAEIRIGHYSNGNIFTQNAGVMIPLTFNLGYTF